MFNQLNKSIDLVMDRKNNDNMIVETGDGKTGGDGNKDAGTSGVVGSADLNVKMNILNIGKIKELGIGKNIMKAISKLKKSNEVNKRQEIDDSCDIVRPNNVTTVSSTTTSSIVDTITTVVPTVTVSRRANLVENDILSMKVLKMSSLKDLGIQGNIKTAIRKLNKESKINHKLLSQMSTISFASSSATTATTTITTKATTPTTSTICKGQTYLPNPPDKQLFADQQPSLFGGHDRTMRDDILHIGTTTTTTAITTTTTIRKSPITTFPNSSTSLLSISPSQQSVFAEPVSQSRQVNEKIKIISNIKLEYPIENINDILYVGDGIGDSDKLQNVIRTIKQTIDNIKVEDMEQSEVLLPLENGTSLNEPNLEQTRVQIQQQQQADPEQQGKTSPPERIKQKQIREQQQLRQEQQIQRIQVHQEQTGLEQICKEETNEKRTDRQQMQHEQIEREQIEQKQPEPEEQTQQEQISEVQIREEQTQQEQIVQEQTKAKQPQNGKVESNQKLEFEYLKQYDQSQEQQTEQVQQEQTQLEQSVIEQTNKLSSCQEQMNISNTSKIPILTEQLEIVKVKPRQISFNVYGSIQYDTSPPKPVTLDKLNNNNRNVSFTFGKNSKQSDSVILSNNEPENNISAEANRMTDDSSAVPIQNLSIPKKFINRKRAFPILIPKSNKLRDKIIIEMNDFRGFNQFEIDSSAKRFHRCQTNVTNNDILFNYPKSYADIDSFSDVMDTSTPFKVILTHKIENNRNILENGDNNIKTREHVKRNLFNSIETEPNDLKLGIKNKSTNWNNRVPPETNKTNKIELRRDTFNISPGKSLNYTPIVDNINSMEGTDAVSFVSNLLDNLGDGVIENKAFDFSDTDLSIVVSDDSDDKDDELDNGLENEIKNHPQHIIQTPSSSTSGSFEANLPSTSKTINKISNNSSDLTIDTQEKDGRAGGSRKKVKKKKRKKIKKTNLDIIDTMTDSDDPQKLLSMILNMEKESFQIEDNNDEDDSMDTTTTTTTDSTLIDYSFNYESAEEIFRDADRDNFSDSNSNRSSVTANLSANQLDKLETFSNSASESTATISKSWTKQIVIHESIILNPDSLPSSNKMLLSSVSPQKNDKPSDTSENYLTNLINHVNLKSESIIPKITTGSDKLNTISIDKPQNEEKLESATDVSKTIVQTTGHTFKSSKRKKISKDSSKNELENRKNLSEIIEIDGNDDNDISNVKIAPIKKSRRENKSSINNLTLSISPKTSDIHNNNNISLIDLTETPTSSELLITDNKTSEIERQFDNFINKKFKEISTENTDIPIKRSRKKHTVNLSKSNRPKKNTSIIEQPISSMDIDQPSITDTKQEIICKTKTEVLTKITTRTTSTSTPLSSSSISDAPIPDASIPDASIPDGTIPDVSIPDASIPNASIPDASIPDASIPDASIPDASIPDTPVREISTLDAPIPDTPIPDTPIPGTPILDAPTLLKTPDVSLNHETIEDSTLQESVGGDANIDETIVTHQEQIEAPIINNYNSLSTIETDDRLTNNNLIDDNKNLSLSNLDGAPKKIKLNKIYRENEDETPLVKHNENEFTYRRGRKHKHSLVDTSSDRLGTDIPKRDNCRLIVKNFADTEKLSKQKKKPDKEKKIPFKKKNKIIELDQDIKCGNCGIILKNSSWKEHYNLHYGLTWKDGVEDPIDLQNQKAMGNKLNNFMKTRKLKSLTCDKCGNVKKSAIGYLSHREGCGSLEPVKVNCVHCGKLLKSCSIVAHEQSHCPALRKLTVIEQPENHVPEPIHVEYSESGRIKRQQKKQKKSTDLYKENIRSIDKITGFIVKRWQRQLNESDLITCNRICCTFTTNDITLMCEHYITCVIMSPERYACKRCVFGLTSYEMIVEHIQRHHPFISENSGVDDGTDDNEINKFDKEADYIPDEIIVDDDEDDNPDDIHDDELNDDDKNKSKKTKMKRESKIRVGAPPPIDADIDKKWIYMYKKIRNTLYKNEPSVYSSVLWTTNFREKNYSNVSLYPLILPGKILCMTNFEQYLPMEFKSIKFSHQIVQKYDLDFAKGKRIESISKWNQLNVFEGAVSDNSMDIDKTKLLYCGGPIQSLAWSTVPDDWSGSQYLAVTCKNHSFNDTIKINHNSAVKCLIQIWEINLLPNITNSELIEESPKYLYSIAYDDGPVMHMKFCPSGGFNDTRLGLLAVPSSVEENINIFALPKHINCVNDGIQDEYDILKKIFHLKPSICLNSNLETSDKPIITRIDWSQAMGHKIIAAGYSNGLIIIWNLDHMNSEILCEMVDDVLMLQPIQMFHASHTCITQLNFHHDDTNKTRWLAVGSHDKHLRLFDLNAIIPLEIASTLLKSRITCGTWSLHWTSIISATDDVYFFNGTLLNMIQPHEIGFKSFSCWDNFNLFCDISFNDWLNAFITVSAVGDILVKFNEQIFIPDRDKIRKLRFVIGFTDFAKLDGNPCGNFIESLPIGDEARSDFIESHGLIFCDMDNIMHPSLSNITTHRSLPVDKYLPSKITQVECNPNAQTFQYFAIGYETGFVRIKSLK